MIFILKRKPKKSRATVVGCPTAQITFRNKLITLESITYMLKFWKILLHIEFERHNIANHSV